jgi:hypothetical protein
MGNQETVPVFRKMKAAMPPRFVFSKHGLESMQSGVVLDGLGNNEPDMTFVL